jgi:hypothetical protein
MHNRTAPPKTKEKKMTTTTTTTTTVSTKMMRDASVTEMVSRPWIETMALALVAAASRREARR